MTFNISLDAEEKIMTSYALPKNVSFRVETLYSGNRRLGRIKPDEYGVYCGLPMMVLGEASQNNTYYDAESLYKQITDSSTRFNKVLTSGKLFGEYGHPVFSSSQSDADKIQRLTTVEEKNTSHLFTALYTDAPSREGTIVVRGDVKPTGPFGQIFKDSLDDPVVNTAFSLRAYVDTKMGSDGLKYRTIRSLTTFDTVGASGFANTDKAHAIGLESFAGDQFLDYEITVMQDGNLMIDQIALESFVNTDLNEIFGTNDVSKIIQSRTFVQVDQSLAERYPNLYRDSVFHEFFKEV